MITRSASYIGYLISAPSIKTLISIFMLRYAYEFMVLPIVSSESSLPSSGRERIVKSLSNPPIINEQPLMLPVLKDRNTSNFSHENSSLPRIFHQRACDFQEQDVMLRHAEVRPTSYIVINEARSGSSWLQEISQMHHGIMVQFELGLEKGDAALQCQKCKRYKVNDTKYPDRLPPKLHPPLACGMTIFGSANGFYEVNTLAGRHNSKIIILMRRNHVAQAVSLFRHVMRKPNIISWSPEELVLKVTQMRNSYSRLIQFAEQMLRPVHFIFYEDMKRNATGVWTAMQQFLDIPLVDVPNIGSLEPRSGEKAAIYHLKHLNESRNLTKDEPWHPMLVNPNFDDDLDISALFEDMCMGCFTAASAFWSWRGGNCPGVDTNRERLVSLQQSQTNPEAAFNNNESIVTEVVVQELVSMQYSGKR